MKLKIEEEFKSLIPPLTEEEYKQLESNLIEDGCREPIVTWKGVIVDGHNRYGICQRHDISFNVEEKQFVNKEAVIEWIIRNQFGRRNLTLMQRSELALRLKPIIQEKAKENKLTAMAKARKNNPNNKQEQFSPNSVKTVDTQKELSKIAGVSHDAIYKTEKILDKGTLEQIERARKGGKGNSLNMIYEEVKQKEIPSKVCSECGKTLPSTDFYKGKGKCKQCFNSSTSRAKDVKGNVYKIADEYKHLTEEEVVGNLYNIEEEVTRTIEDAIDLFDVNFKKFLFSMDILLEPYSEQIKENNKKMMAVLQEAVTTINQWKGKYQYEK